MQGRVALGLAPTRLPIAKLTFCTHPAMSGSMLTEGSIALMWDFDGTLVDSACKNLAVTRALIEFVSGKPHTSFSALSDLNSYYAAHLRSRNWRDFYGRELGLSESETDEAGRLWTEFQIQDNTEAPLFAGVSGVVTALRHVPQGIVSQNSRDNIIRMLQGTDLDGRFVAILGFESVPMSAQKPAPDALIACLDVLTRTRPGVAFYVGDHATDFECVTNARAALADLQAEVELRSIGVGYGRNDRSWPVQPDFIARRPGDITRFIDAVLTERS